MQLAIELVAVRWRDQFRIQWVRSTSAKTKGYYSLRLNLGLNPNLRPNFTSRRRFGLRPDLSPNFGLSLKAETGLSSTFGLRLKSWTSLNWTTDLTRSAKTFSLRL